jgi:membrane associated rhomboid family serine protease
MRKPFTTAAVILFALIAVLHVLRVVFSWEVMIGNVSVPMWASVLGAVVAALLAFMVKREADARYA